MAGGNAKVEVRMPSGGGKATSDRSPVASVAHVDAGFRRGVAPGSFIDLLVRANDRTTGSKFSDTELASQVRNLSDHLYAVSDSCGCVPDCNAA